jgi:hypothetical protein
VQRQCFFVSMAGKKRQYKVAAVPICENSRQEGSMQGSAGTVVCDMTNRRLSAAKECEAAVAYRQARQAERSTRSAAW